MVKFDYVFEQFFGTNCVRGPSYITYIESYICYIYVAKNLQSHTDNTHETRKSQPTRLMIHLAAFFSENIK